MKALLKVQIEPWSGTPGGHPPSSELTTEVTDGDVLADKLPKGMSTGKIVVKSISAQNIVFQIWDLAPRQPDGRMDIFASGPGMESTLQKREQLMVGTLTTDAGTSYKVTLIDLLN